MNIVVSGANGFLGSHLVRRLAVEGWKVIALVRPQSDLRRLSDICDIIQIAPILSDSLGELVASWRPVHAVIHAATDYGLANRPWSELLKTNLLFGMQLAEAAIRAGTRCFINAGSALPPEVSPYALSKHQFSMWLQALAAGGQTCFIDVILETMYGEDDDPRKFITRAIVSCLQNAEYLPLTFGEQKRDFIYIKDVTEAFAILVDCYAHSKHTPTPAYRRYPVGSGVAVTIRQVTQLIHRLTHSQTRLDFGAVPYRPNEVMFSQADLTKMNALGWSPRYSLEDGLKRTIAWWQIHLENVRQCAG